MTDTNSTRVLPIVLVLFAASGCAALIYEVVWFQLLMLVIGSTAYSLGVLLATFMGGLCLGSYLLPRLKQDFGHPLKLYAWIELGIAASGLAVLWGLPLVDGTYILGVQSDMASILMRGFICALCMLVPTILMGASLPAISRFIAATPKGVTWWGWLYTGNTIGAVLGVFLAGFILLRLYNLDVATYAAMAINIVAALGSFAVARMVPAVTAPAENAEAPVVVRDDAGSAWPIYLTIALSGATALGAQVVWTRLLGMMFGATVYAFSVILAVFLVGLGIGSALGSLVLRYVHPRTALGWCQLLLVLGIAWAAYMINAVLPYIEAGLGMNPWEVALSDVARALLALLPATILWGASFPLAMAAAARTGAAATDSARPVSAVYAANTFGGIIGALSVSMVLIITIGVQNTQRLMLLLAAFSALILLLPAVLKSRNASLGGAVAVGLAAAALLTWTLPNQPPMLVAYGRFMPAYLAHTTVVDQVEGRNSGVVITRYNADGLLQISVGGHVEASVQPYDMRLQRMVGHLPALIHPNPKKILGIGFGAGVSAGTFTRYPTVESITIAEIEPAVPPISTKYFAEANFNVKNDPRTRIAYDDARHFLLTTTEKFDIIASDPLDVWVKGTASIYSLDYFEMVKKRLNPGGYFTLYVPLYESSEEVIRTELATFFKAFPNGTVWSNTIDGKGYDLVLMGQADPLKIDVDAVEAKMRSPGYEPVLKSMNDIGYRTVSDMYATYAGQGSDMTKWLEGAQLNTDRDLRLMYLAGWTFNAQIADELHRKIMSFRKQPPPGMFTGTPATTGNLFYEMMTPWEQKQGG